MEPQSYKTPGKYSWEMGLFVESEMFEIIQIEFLDLSCIVKL